MTSMLFANHSIANVMGNSEHHGDDPASPDYLFYDERFSFVRKAIQKQTTRLNSNRIIPTRGDVTDIWNHRLKQTGFDESLTLQGMTTESFLFCLERLLHTNHQVETTVQRVDRDIYVWSLTAKIKNKY